MWLDITSRLGGSIQEVKRKTLSREFVRWKVWLEDEWNRVTILHWYLAQISHEVRLVLASEKEAKKCKVSDKILKFDVPAPPASKTTKKRTLRKPKKVGREEKERRAMISKSIWMGALGFKPEKDK